MGKLRLRRGNLLSKIHKKGTKLLPRIPRSQEGHSVRVWRPWARGQGVGWVLPSKIQNAKPEWSQELVWERTLVADSSSKGPSWTRELSYPGTFHGPGSSCHVYPGPFREGREVLRFHLQTSGWGAAEEPREYPNLGQWLPNSSCHFCLFQAALPSKRARVQGMGNGFQIKIPLPHFPLSSDRNFFFPQPIKE